MADVGSPATICEAFQATAARYPRQVALRTPGGAVTLTWEQYASRVRKIAAGLAELGVGRGDTVALMMTNRPEFHLVDTAAFHLGAVAYSVYNTFAPEQITQVLSNAGSQVVVCEQQFAPRLLAIKDGTAVGHVVCVDGKPDGTITLEELVAGGDPEFGFEACWQAVRPGDVLTLIYTSGTTGPPKGWRSPTRRRSPGLRRRTRCGRAVRGTASSPICRWRTSPSATAATTGRYSVACRSRRWPTRKRCPAR